MKSIKPKKAKKYWRRMLDSSYNKMSRGAQYINRLISWPRGENWRRKDKKQRGRDLGHKSRER